MPTAPLLRELVEKYRPPTRQSLMSRTGSLASQPSAGTGSQLTAAQQAAGGGGGPGAAAQRQRYMQQQMAAAGGMATAGSMQQPMQQHVAPQAQQAHPAGVQVQQQGDVVMTQAAAQ
jgi:hypothetical protein